MNARLKPLLSVMVGEANFGDEVLRSNVPVLATFLAPWSRPCQIIKPVLGEVAAVCGGEVKFVEINADDHPGLGLEYDVQSIPALLFFVAGTLRGRIVGTASAEAILAKCRTVFAVAASANSSKKQKS